MHTASGSTGGVPGALASTLEPVDEEEKGGAAQKKDAGAGAGAAAAKSAADAKAIADSKREALKMGAAAKGPLRRGGNKKTKP